MRIVVAAQDVAPFHEVVHVGAPHGPVPSGVRIRPVTVEYFVRTDMHTGPRIGQPRAGLSARRCTSCDAQRGRML